MAPRRSVCQEAVPRSKPLATGVIRPRSAVDRRRGLSPSHSPTRVASRRVRPHAPTIFVVTGEDEAAIRAVYEQRGEFAAAVELRRLFPGITDNAQARACARTIAGWKPLPLRPVKRMPKEPRLRRVR